MKLKNLFTTLFVIGCLMSGVRAQQREGGYFRVIITGFTCHRPTADDPLQRDGVDDEVQLHADTYELTPTSDSFAQPLGFYLRSRSVRSATIGDTNNHANRIQGGSGQNFFGGNGGFRAGDSFPDQTPWAPSPLFLSRRDVQLNQRPPMVMWEGSLYCGLSAVVIIPTIWEIDDQLRGSYGNDSHLIPILAPGGRWSEASRTIPSMDSLVAKLATDSKANYTPVIDAIKESFNRSVVIQNQLVGEPADRPIGMKSRGSYYSFVPEVLVLNYELAQELSQGNFNGAVGVLAINYRDADELRGDYTLYLKIERR